MEATTVARPQDVTVYFGINHTDVISGPVDIRPFALYLQTHPRAKIKLEGHANAHKDVAYTDALSYKRAQVVARALIEAGLPASAIVLSFKGQRELMGDPSTRSGAASNRRVVMSIIE
jgi:peptidoglycan-associated lipoprotein